MNKNSMNKIHNYLLFIEIQKQEVYIQAANQ